MLSIFGELVLRERGPDRLVMRLPGSHRIIFAALSALSLFILCFGVLFEGEPTVFLGRNAVAGLLVLATVFGLLYEDRWTFDRRAGRVENRSGTLVLARRSGFAMADLERISLERFTRGRLAEDGPESFRSAGSGAAPFAESLRPRRRWGQQRIVRLVAVDRAGEVRILDAGPAHRLAQFRARGLRIAGFCGVRFADATTV